MKLIPFDKVAYIENSCMENVREYCRESISQLGTMKASNNLSAICQITSGGPWCEYSDRAK